MLTVAAAGRLFWLYTKTGMTIYSVVSDLSEGDGGDAFNEKGPGVLCRGLRISGSGGRI